MDLTPALDTPSPARVYDYFLGGSHNFAADRALAARMEQAMPDIGHIMRANRAFLRRAVRALVDAGIRQFLDLGSGIPTVGNVHEVAGQAAPDTVVAYVDIDPVAYNHSRRLLADDPRAVVLHADLTRPDAVLDDPTLHDVLDLDRPVAVLLAGVLHQLTTDPAPIIARYRDRLAPGSYLALSHASSDERSDALALRDTYNQGYANTARMTLRSRSEIERLFTGYTLIPPGLVQLPEWRPDWPVDPDEDARRFSTYCGVGRLD
ncbi:SAM-dependent methyltransferase [Micromonospora aurantiaca (nom. illeg.)]|uniref:SAM-dependent methyltransferase n=1 Tax=Micromonospora aurantiaca (nom. illeg.) TaxID=47850 RepID=UPI0033F66692